MTNKNIILEEIASSITHGLGMALSLAGLVVLIFLSLKQNSARLLTAVTIYGLTLVLLYTFSTLYHSIQAKRAKHVFRILDHCSIYLLIAGTYTPLMLVVLHNWQGWIILGTVWVLAVLGIIFKIFFINRFTLLAILSYLFIGWLALIVLRPLISSIRLDGLIWLIVGGLTYSLGIVFYALKRLPFNHCLWHLFVLAGSLIHYFSVVFSVVLR